MHRETPQQTELRARAAHFANDQVAPHIAEMDRTNEYPWHIVEGLAREGFMGMTIPQAYGGGGRSLMDMVVVVEELAKVFGTIARIVVDANTAIPKAILEHGTEEQKRTWLPKIVKGDKPAIAITEPEAGSAATSMTTSAVREGEDIVLNGKKCWITGAGVSRTYLVFARFGETPGAEGIGGVLVSADTPGLSVARVPMMMGLRGMPEGEVVFEHCRVPAENLLVPPGDGFKKLMRCYNLQRVGAATVALGIAQGALDLAVDYAAARKQFGQPIGDFQGIRWKLADMHIKLESGRMLVHRAASELTNGYPNKVNAALAKVSTAEAAIEVTNAALQIHGANGYSCDYPVERMVRDARMFAIGGGTAEMQRNLIGEELITQRAKRLKDVA
ncbi:acyl-CoA dehydrogenase family protein [Dichotomicrobium thermohalophilum]|uniref:3-sulfinopropanoyl-CoA desulfinase n=1 Tax=Dichotomicrobium thermohalophilum TaxID=933063 RepID=A0A397Q6B7_9HYPH|nr:acyl-CoA dehydrogenase family protein [Dichotomicrobium thermohalophilum]RIA56009.1 hypothetical protein BXY53_1100 [Dichotomicrobium thermohalophilum]